MNSVIVAFLFRMAYAIVHFEKENTVAVVPTSWTENENRLCYWPPLQGRQLETAVRNRQKYDCSWKFITDTRVLRTYGLFLYCKIHFVT